ncbi:MAG: 1-acyl-sn-glycerol-3-phosphate acyltransferase [Oscillospiraceae bacterium]|nr:1-acyl-sn-glycerol-3-phosphate acyltransferase [Oscillospiraceae bacterium]
MEQTERNWTLLPFLGFAALFALAMDLLRGYRGAALAGMTVLWFFVGLIAGAALFLLALWIISLFIDKSRPQKDYAPFYNQMVVYVTGLCCAFFRVRIHVSGREKLPEGCFLLVENHPSGFDPLLTAWALRKRRFALIAKPEIMALPVIGPFMHRACCLGIDRENDRAALRTILDAAALIRDGVVSVGIFPEGTRNYGKGLLPFRNGAFKIAQRAKAPVAVAVVRGSENITKRFPWHGTDVWLSFPEVFDADTVRETPTPELGERAGALMCAELEQIY